MRTHPSRLVRLLTRGLVLRELPPAAGRSILLTFDDGPTEGVLEGVLERLREHDARAVFFVLGHKAEKAPRLLQRILEAGHAIGNHSHTHPSARLPAPRGYLADVRTCSEIVAQAVGAPPRLFRAPEGRLHPASLLGPARLGMKHVLWSLDSNDWRCTDADMARASAQSVLDGVRPGDIILLHEFSHWIHEILDRILPVLRERGYDLRSGLTHLPG